MAFAALFLPVLLSLPPADLGQALRTLRQVGPDSQGSQAAAAAWPIVAAADAEQLTRILASMDHASPLARNWIRSALDPVLKRAGSQKTSLPVKDLTAFLLDQQHDAQARRLAFELLTARDPAARERFLKHMLNDPSPELRHDAVAQVLAQAEKPRGSSNRRSRPRANEASSTRPPRPCATSGIRLTWRFSSGCSAIGS